MMAISQPATAVANTVNGSRRTVSRAMRGGTDGCDLAHTRRHVARAAISAYPMQYPEMPGGYGKRWRTVIAETPSILAAPLV